MHRIHLTERELQELEEREDLGGLLQEFEDLDGHELEELVEAFEVGLFEEVCSSSREPAPGKPLDFGA